MINTRTLLVVSTLVLMLSLMACQKRVDPALSTPVCKEISGFKLRPAIDAAKQNLRNGCSSFSITFVQLLEVAKRSPSKSNRTLIRDFCQWSAEAGHAPKFEVVEMFKKYFGPRLRVSDSYSIASTLENNPGALERELRKALAYREEGCKATGDKKEYAFVVEEFNGMIKVIDAMIISSENRDM